MWVRVRPPDRATRRGFGLQEDIIRGLHPRLSAATALAVKRFSMLDFSLQLPDLYRLGEIHSKTRG